MRLTYEDLRICHSLVREANDLKERLERLRTLAEWGATDRTSCGFGSSPGDRVGKMVSSLADMEREGQAKIDAYLTHAHLVDAAIAEEVEDSTQRTILRLRYLDGLSWEEISERAHYHVRWCKELHARGLKSLGIATQHTKAH